MTPTKSLPQTRFAKLLPLLILVLISAVALLWKLGTGSLAAWDEAIYAQVSKEILQSGDWLTMHWSFAPWFEKPPLFMWITAVVYRVFGISEFSARLPAALSGIGLVALTYMIGRFLYAKLAGFLAAIVLLTCYHFLSFSRFGTMEVMLTLFTYLAVYAYLRLREGRREWWYLVWMACALALMVKGAGGIIAPAAIMLGVVLDGSLKTAVRSRELWLGGLLALLMIAPWHVLMYVWYGRSFTAEYVGYHVIARATSTLEGNASGYFYYAGKLIDGFFPWCLLAPFAVISFIRNRDKGPSRSWILLVLIAFVFGLYTLIPTRRPWYIVPVYPALAVLISAFIVGLHQTYRLRPVYRWTIRSVGAILIILAGFYSFVSVMLNRKPEEPVARLARLAQSKDLSDKEPLILLAENERFYAQVPLFYSNRPVALTYFSAAPSTEDARRYVSFQNLEDVLQGSDKQIILPKNEVQRLAVSYDIRVIAEADPLVYATIQRR